MDLSEQAIHDVIHPTAAFCEVPKVNGEAKLSTTQPDRPWEDSMLNPKNRIDSLDVPERPLWKIDGCTGFGGQIYATPLFYENMPPLRMDVFTPEPSAIHPELRRLLDVDYTFHTRDKACIEKLGFMRHVLRILHHWASRMEDPRKMYENVAFGSRIILRNMPVNIADAVIVVANAHFLERQLLPLAVLQNHWADDQIKCFPPSVDLSELVYLEQLHDSVSLVRLEGKISIFKGLTSYSKFLYHELRQLLKIPSHPNVMSRPSHLVTKKCSFGGKTAVVGFILELHKHGSMRELVPFLELHGQVSLADKVKWSLQLTSALVHLRTIPGMFYPDLRLDNIVLTESRDLVMVDFEQRGVWCEFGAPEVNAIDYICTLARDEDIPEDVAQKYRGLLSSLLPGWEHINEGEDYKWPNEGYNISWACLTPVEQEACEVYMLARVLWCLFEAKSAPQRAAVWMSYRWEPSVDFPGYTKTPEPIRNLIDRCTRGRRPGLSKYVVRDGNQLVLRELEHTGRSSAQQVQQTAKEWWAREIKASEDWLRERADGMKGGCWRENYYDRPTLREVYAELQAFQDGVISS